VTEQVSRESSRPIARTGACPGRHAPKTHYGPKRVRPVQYKNTVEEVADATCNACSVPAAVPGIVPRSAANRASWLPRPELHECPVQVAATFGSSTLVSRPRDPKPGPEIWLDRLVNVASKQKALLSKSQLQIARRVNYNSSCVWERAGS
jgi:hypothetical protein